MHRFEWYFSELFKKKPRFPIVLEEEWPDLNIFLLFGSWCALINSASRLTHFACNLAMPACDYCCYFPHD